MPYEAELKKLNELLTKSHSSASLQDRQAFQEYLLHLASLPSYDMKSRFATHIHRTFATFDKDQDPVIDAVMDLCEDKDVKIRILGIKALKNTATADARWVKGNIGVLLQLLDSSGEELHEVHKALKGLISVDPIVAFQSIAKDLLADDAGVSRSKVIRFLWEEAKPERRNILGSGENEPAEKAFGKAFEEVLATLKRGSDDWKDVDDMLRDMSINRRRRSQSPRRDNQVPSSGPRGRSPVPPSRPSGPSSSYPPPRYDDRPRYPSSAAPPAGPRRDGPPSGPAGQRARSPPRGPGGPAPYARGPPPAGPRHSGGGPSYRQPSGPSGYRDDGPPPGPPVGYRSNDYRDRPMDNSRDRGRPDHSPRRDDRYPFGSGSRYRNDSPDRYRSNDRRARSPDRPRYPDRRSRSRTRSPPRSRRDDSRDRSRRSSPPRPVPRKSQAADGRSSLDAQSTPLKSTHQDVASDLRDSLPATMASATAIASSHPTPTLQIRGEAPIVSTDSQKPAAPSIAIRGESRSNAKAEEAGSHPAKREVERSGTDRSDTFSGRELLSTPATDAAVTPTTPAPAGNSREASRKKWADTVGTPTSDQATTRSLKDRLSFGNGEAGTPEPKSLAERLGGPQSGRGKRRRDEAASEQSAVESARPSLIARISSSNDIQGNRGSKKARTSLPGTIDTKSSLLSRMSGGPGSAPSTPSMGPPSTPNAGGAPGAELSIRNASAVRSASPANGFSIKGATPTPSPLTAQRNDYFPTQGTQSTVAAQPTPGLAKTMSIKAFGSTTTGPTQHAATAVAPAPAPANPDEGVRRKGRGFAKPNEGSSIFQLPTATPAGPASNGNGNGLAQRLGGGLASRLGGRR